MQSVQSCDIDPTGVFKYILIDVKDDNESKYAVRGYKNCSFHPDIYEQFMNNDIKKLGDTSLKAEAVGGGRIEHEPEKKHIKVYGYSQSYGQANHSISVEILKKQYPDYEIEYSNEGY